MNDAWAPIANLEQRTLVDLFRQEPDRLSRFAIEEANIRFDFSKTHLDAEAVTRFEALALARDLSGARDALFAGAPINVTEGRAVEHSAERGQGAPESVQRARSLHARMRALIDAIEADAFGPGRRLLHLGLRGAAGG